MLALVLAGLLAVAPLVQAQVAPEPLKTVTYDVADLVQKTPSWSGAEPPLDALVRVIVSGVNPESWRRKEAPATILVLDGTKLEIQATAKDQAEITELLAALRRLADLAVVVEVKLYEVNRTWYKENLEGWLKKGEAAVPEETVQALAKNGQVIQTNKVTILPGQGATILSRRRAIAYEGSPADAKAWADTLKPAFVGLVCKAEVSVTPDRRFVRLKLTQQVSELVKLARETGVHPATGQQLTYEDPRIAEVSAATTVKLDDGVSAIVPVPRARVGGAEPDKVQLLLLHPVIRIEEEERERNKKP
jgi:hypothetical protein